MYRFTVLLTSLTLALSGCGTHTGAGLSPSITPNLNAANNVTDLTEGHFFRVEDAFNLMSSSIGQNTATGLQSLKYYVLGIRLCQDLTVNGSGYSGASGCIDLIKFPNDPNFAYDPSKDYSNLATAAVTYESKFTDLMDSASRKALSSAVDITSSNVGTYKWGVTNWYPVTIVKGSITGGSTTYNTLAGTVSRSNQGFYSTTSTGNFTTASSPAESVLLLGNGGNNFKLQTPFVIAQSDIDNKTQFAVDLTFNPVGLMKAYPNGINPPAGGGGTLKDAGGNAFTVPMITLTPCFRKSTEDTLVETYMGTVAVSGGDNFDVRLQLYYNSADTTKAVIGVGASSLVNSNTTSSFAEFPTLEYVTSNTDGTLNFQDWSQTNIVSNFKRGTKLQDTTTATILCSSTNGVGGVINGCSTSVSTTFTLTEVSKLNQ